MLISSHIATSDTVQYGRGHRLGDIASGSLAQANLRPKPRMKERRVRSGSEGLDRSMSDLALGNDTSDDVVNTAADGAFGSGNSSSNATENQVRTQSYIGEDPWQVNRQLRYHF